MRTTGIETKTWIGHYAKEYSHQIYNRYKLFRGTDYPAPTPAFYHSYTRFNNLKSQNPDLKTMLAVGGWNMGSAPFTHMVSTAATRQVMYHNITKSFIQKKFFFLFNTKNQNENKAHSDIIHWLIN